jgi:hypothetical protein
MNAFSMRKGPLYLRDAIIFLSQKMLMFGILIQITKHTRVLYTCTIVCIFISVAIGIVNSELVFYMEVKILLCLHFAIFTIHNGMFTAIFSLHTLHPLFKHY